MFTKDFLLYLYNLDDKTLKDKVFDFYKTDKIFDTTESFFKLFICEIIFSSKLNNSKSFLIMLYHIESLLKNEIKHDKKEKYRNEYLKHYQEIIKDVIKNG